MLALVKAEAGPGLRLTEVPRPEIGINDVLIRVHKTGICGTDLHIESWDAWAAKTIHPPQVIGHEFVGEVVEVGSNVTDFHAGDLVSGEGHVTCGRCRHCMAGQRHLCANTLGLGVNRDGAFAEYVALPMTNIWHHWDGIDEEVAAIFDPFGNAVHTALAFEVHGEDVLISGAGPIGLMTIPVVRHAGARHVVVSEPIAFRRELAERMGATIAIDPTNRDLGDVQRQLGMVEGFDVVLEMSGHPAALKNAIANMAHGGRLAQLGIPTGDITLDVHAIVFNQLTLRGIYGRQMYETWYQMAVLISAGIDIKPVITHRFDFREFEAAFAAARSGDSGKVIMDWGDGMTRTRDPLAFVAAEIEDLKQKHLYRPLRIMSAAQGPVTVVDGREVISLSSNDYLGLTHHPRLRDAAMAAIGEFGVGSGAVRTIAGTMTEHEALESELAAFKGVEAVLTFQSGFTANTGVIPTITGEQDLIVSDALNHASIIDGMRLSKAPRKVFPHRDVVALREILQDAAAKGRPDGSGPYRLILVVTDGVFSMDGDIAPLPGIVEAAEEVGAAVFVDDAHASGVLGRDGRGSVDHFGLHGRVDIQVGTMSKAMGVLGGYVAGSLALRELLVQRARPFLFSTSHPPADAAACRAAIRVMQDEPWRIERLWASTKRFKAELTRLGFDTGRSETPITPIIVGDSGLANRFSARMFEEGVFATSVIYPTVALDQARLRTIVTAALTDEHLDRALEAFARVGRELGLVAG